MEQRYGVMTSQHYAAATPPVEGAQWTGVVTRIACEMLQQARRGQAQVYAAWRTCMCAHMRAPLGSTFIRMTCIGVKMMHAAMCSMAAWQGYMLRAAWLVRLGQGWVEGSCTVHMHFLEACLA